MKTMFSNKEMMTIVISVSSSVTSTKMKTSLAIRK